jgi:hypothetical protein
VLELRDQIRAALDDRLDAKIYEPFEVSRSFSAGEERVLLRGIGCPNHSSVQTSRIIIVLEEIGPLDGDERGDAVRKEPARQSARS